MCGNDEIINAFQTTSQLVLRYKWLIVGTNENMNDQLSYYLSKSPILPGSSIFVVSKLETNEFTLQNVYKTAINEPLIFHDYRPFNDRLNLHGIKLKSMATLSSNDSLMAYRYYR